MLPNRWAYLGKYTFAGDSSDYIDLTNQTLDLDTGLSVVADAVMFAPSSDGPPPTPTPQPPQTVISARLDGDRPITQLDDMGHSGYVYGATSISPGYNGLGGAYRFDPTDNVADKIVFYPFTGANDMQLGNSPYNSFTAELWFRPDAGAYGERTLANAYYNGGTGTNLKGWKLTYDVGAHLLKFKIYAGSDQPVAEDTLLVNLPNSGPMAAVDAFTPPPLTPPPATIPWIYVRAIKNGARNQLYLCGGADDSLPQLSDGQSFAQGVSYYDGTQVDLGVDYDWAQDRSKDPNTSWRGDLDQFTYKNWADHSKGCKLTPLPTPTDTATPTPTIPPATPLPPARVAYVSMNEGWATPMQVVNKLGTPQPIPTVKYVSLCPKIT